MNNRIGSRAWIGKMAMRVEIKPRKQISATVTPVARE
jgi:hypothetical protein